MYDPLSAEVMMCDLIAFKSKSTVWDGRCTSVKEFKEVRERP